MEPIKQLLAILYRRCVKEGALPNGRNPTFSFTYSPAYGPTLGFNFLRFWMKERGKDRPKRKNNV